MEVDTLLELTVGQLRELIAYADSDEKIGHFWDNCVSDDDLERVGYDPYDDEEDEDDFDESEEDDSSFDDEDEDESHSDDEALEDPEEEALAQSIADDINAGRYTFDAIYGIYPEHIISRIEELA